MNIFVYHEVRIATHLSEKSFVLQTLIHLQHRNQLILYSFGGSKAPPGHIPPTVSFLAFLFTPPSPIPQGPVQYTVSSQ